MNRSAPHSGHPPPSASVAIWAGRDAQISAADRVDRSLLVTALGISRDTAISGGDVQSRETRDLLRNTSGGPVFYHVYAPDRVFVTGYATPPVPPRTWTAATTDFKARSADLAEAANHAARLTEDLLTFERARSAPPIDSLPVSPLKPLLEDVVFQMQPKAKVCGVSLGLFADDGIQARTDPVLLQEAVRNLISNALAHGGDGLNWIEVRLLRSDSLLQLTVSDDGQGIEPEHHDVALSRFGQVTPGSGSGLGLPIARAVAEALGGRLELGTPEKGLEVRITLPEAGAAQ